MIQPGSKNWIDKYFSLIEEEKIDVLKHADIQSDTLDAYLHNLFFKSGIIFGFPCEFIFFNDKISDNWTDEEKMSLLLFECLLLIYISEKKQCKKEELINSLLEFYQKYQDNSLFNITKIIFKETDGVKLENILKRRVHPKSTFGNRLWINYIENSLIYLDVIAFRSFLQHQREITESYSVFMKGTLYTIGVMSLIDKNIDAEEKSILNVFLNSIYLNETDKMEFNDRLKSQNLTVQDITIPKYAENLYRLYLIDMAILTIHSDISEISQDSSEEIIQLNELCAYLSIDLTQLRSAIIFIEKFIMENNHKIIFFHQSTSYERLVNNFSKRWIKILGRNKDKVVEELKESRELIALVNKSLQTELTDDEKEKVKSQFGDIVKSLPAFAIFMLPGGMILLPIILKIIPDLLPSAFRDNETPK